MFLKRLEVKGFKSFAEPILIDFVPGVTSVVGPNGSGKSNIADAVRWVLGEQSAKSLRGAKMEDIIFAGSDSRKAVNVAEVSLVLDNEDEHLAIDYSEVSVTRRLYRSGESEYLLNRTPCRLKDIVDLFLDSGLGREAYSIIGQGKIEEILSSKAENRRTIFEEAAGVLKYKTRKVKAEKRLSQTEDNLLRVADILNELETQVEPLQEQASIAKDYLELKEEQEALDIQVIAQEITDLHSNWTEESTKLASLKEQLIERQRKLEDSEARLKHYREKHAAMRDEVARAQESRLRVSEELEKNEGRRGVLEERQKNALQNEEQLSAAISDKEERLEKANEKLAYLNEAHAKLLEEKQAHDATLNELQHMLNSSKEDLAAEIEDAKGDFIEWLNEQASLRNERRYLEEQLSQKERHLQRAETEKHSLKSEHASLKKEVYEKEQLLNQARSIFEQLKQDLKTLQRDEEALKDRYYKQEAKLYEAYGVLQKVTARQEALQEMEEDYAGFYHGVKEVLKQRDKALPGVIGAAAELMTVPKKIEKAIELALGAQAQHVVVADEASARQAIGFLKKQRLGRATFLPLTTMKPRLVPSALLATLEQSQGYVGVAADLIQSNEAHKNVIDYLLGSTIIADTLPDANNLAKKSSHRYRIVTLEGDIVNPGGSMTGGSSKQNQSSLISRRREKAELITKKNQLDEAIVKLEQQVKDGKSNRDKVKLQIDELLLRQNALEEDVVQKQRDSQDYAMRYERLNQELERMERQSSEQNAEEEKAKERLAEIGTAEVHATSEAARIEAHVEQLEKQLQTQQASKEKHQADFADMRVKQAELKQQLQYSSAQVQELETLFTQLETELETDHEHYALIHSSSGEQALTKDSLAKRITEGHSQKQELMKTIEQLEVEEKKLNAAYDQLEWETKQEQGEHTYMLDESQKLEVRVNRLDVDLDYRLNRLREEYELSYEAAVNNYPLKESLDQVKIRLTLIKRSIEELGTVNLGAIEEYDRVKERYEFLQTQKNDLLEARVSLDQAISEMDEEMVKRFSETFDQIRTHFQVVFAQLFGGGDADLVLTDKTNLLTTGIDIVARPPGKKRQQLGLLSGGERALTAIALLFAILQVRPVPFCVLDEVEAALDEANVSRFAQYLRDFSEKTQFIVITHRKGTMEGADVLYGVTMEESGVSRLVSVKLEETKQLIES